MLDLGQPGNTVDLTRSAQWGRRAKSDLEGSYRDAGAAVNFDGGMPSVV
jgi:hypothetical protein